MSHTKQRQPTGATNLNHILASEARLSRLHRLFKSNYDVTEPSLILEPYLYLGNCISAHDTNSLSNLGIRYILNVAIRDVEVCPYYSNDMRTLTIDLRDDDRENILRAFDQAFAFIDEAKRIKSRVLVHCSHGQSRSPTIVIGYLMRTYNVSLEQCLTHVVKARPCVLPNDGFLKQLILYDRFLVDRRRQREEAALMKNVTTTSPPEIPIQHDSTVVQQPPTSTAPIILAPPQYPASEVPNPTTVSSVDSSSLGQTTTSSIQSSTSADSIHIVPIQVPLKVSRQEKVEQIPVKKHVVKDKPVEQETKKNIKQSKEKVVITNSSKISSKPKLEITSSNYTAASKKRQNALITSITKRSQSAYDDRRHVNRYNYSSPSQRWNVINYYPSYYHLPREEPRTRYITEIYDKATNRFIPATC